MEKQVSPTTKKEEGKNRGASKNTKFVGVRQRPSGKWVAEIKNTSQKIRMWLGTFDTAEKAARAYDEAACLLRGSNTRTNFVNQHNFPPNSALSLKIQNLLNHKKGLKQTASKTSATQSGITTAATTTTPTTGSNITTSTSSVASGLKQDVQNFVDESDAYKPDLSNFNGGFEMGTHQYIHSSSEFTSAGFDMGNMGGTGEICQADDFERMKVEREISASLYVMNGVNEYWENVDDSSTGDAFGDIPMLCQMFYLS